MPDLVYVKDVSPEQIRVVTKICGDLSILPTNKTSSKKQFYKSKIPIYNNSMITLTFSNGKTIQAKNDVTAKEVLENFEKTENLVAVKINNEVCSLNQSIKVNSNIEPIYINSTEGSSIYRRSLCFVLASAAQKLFPNKRLLVGHSLGYGYYYTFDNSEITQDEIASLKSMMAEIIASDKQIAQEIVSYQDATNRLSSQNMTETRKQLDFIAKPTFIMNVLEGFSDIYYAPLVESTGILKVFDLVPYEKGFLLRFPTTKDPEKLSEFVDSPKLFGVYKKYKEWGKMLGVTSAASLNEMVYNRKTKDFINLTETLQNKCIAEIADQIKARGNVKVVLIAGPSSSGKTTTSKKLSMQLEVLGYKPHVISLDNYYVGREKTPRDENGDYDYECLEALDVAQLNDHLLRLFKGEEIQVPSYDFKEGKQYFTGKTLKLSERDILIMEGIHGLNDKLTHLIPDDTKFKIYLSALTQLNLDDHNRIPTSDNRLIRRIVRDSQFRGKSAADTIKMWPSVQRGERLHIFPFQNNADAMLNTALDYELAVLRVYVVPLLRCVKPYEKEYAESSRLLRFLDNFYSIPSDCVPKQSIIREFIGGSEFKY